MLLIKGIQDKLLKVRRNHMDGVELKLDGIALANHGDNLILDTWVQVCLPILKV